LIINLHRRKTGCVIAIESGEKIKEIVEKYKKELKNCLTVFGLNSK